MGERLFSRVCIVFVLFVCISDESIVCCVVTSDCFLFCLLF